jgi:hypothetical protein
MMEGTKNFLKDISTEDDGNSVFCYIRVLSILGGFVLLGIIVAKAGADIKHFDIENAGRALMEYLGGCAVAIFAKTKSGA